MCNTSKRRGERGKRKPRKGRRERKKSRGAATSIQRAVTFTTGEKGGERSETSLLEWLEREWKINKKKERTLTFGAGQLWINGWRKIKRNFWLTKVRWKGHVLKLEATRRILESGATVTLQGIARTTTATARNLQELRWLLRKPRMKASLAQRTTHQLVGLYRAAGLLGEKKTKNDLRLSINKAIRIKTGIGVRKRVTIKVKYDSTMLKQRIRTTTEMVVDKRVEDATIASLIKRKIRVVKVSRRGRICTLSRTKRKEEGYVRMDFETIYKMVDYDLEHAYVICGEMIKRQTSGIPMGKSLSPVLATITCVIAEMKFITSLGTDSRLVRGWRIIDDITVIVGTMSNEQIKGRAGEIFEKFEQSYDSNLQLERKDNQRDWWRFLGGKFFIIHQPLRLAFVPETKNVDSLREDKRIKYKSMQDFSSYSEKKAKKATLSATLKRLWDSSTCKVLVISSLAYAVHEANLRGYTPEVSLGALAKLAKATGDTTEEIRLQLETNLNEKWRQQTAQAEQAAQKAAHQAIQQAAQLAAQQAAELAVRQATERAAQAAENLRRTSGFELNGDGRRDPNRSTRGKKTTTVENEDTNMEGSDTSDSQLSDTDESDEDLKKIIIKLRKARKAKKNQRKEKGKGPAAPLKQQACKTTTEKGESSRGKRYVPCDDDLRCANDIGAGFGTNDIEVGFGTETGGLRDYNTPRRLAGMRFGMGRTEEDWNVCDEPRTPQKVFSTKKAPALRKICQKKGIKYTKKPEVIDLLAREQVMTTYDGFNEGDRSTAGQSTIRLGETTPATTGGERPGSRDRTPRSAPSRLNSDISTEGERRESS
ncbi:hypothetical protein CBR_g32069 [Chara braunii]|uniref:Uncharacterized protein n=1 Tax=Chara braunii TaxID=69332 RepID=A0A388LGE4_CHABU|nr:hypothetical protein CBR_g32069 [Chara braunii]|eukprot:GBG81395.1 hypothetical protein CBR_g32069 [Chara braunii]